MWGGGWLRIERKGGRRAGLIRVEMSFDCGDLRGVSVGGVARVFFLQFLVFFFFFFSFSRFHSPFPPLYHMDDTKNDNSLLK